jgi:FixJ family two-component response regulator
LSHVKTSAAAAAMLCASDGSRMTVLRMMAMTPDAQDADPIPTILVVDDDLGVRNSIKFSLEVEGFAVRVYANAGALLDAPDLPARACLVVDDDLRDMSGLELLARLRDRAVRWPTILVTSHPTVAVRNRASSVGIEMVEKPLLGDALVHAVRNAIGLAH